MNIEGLIAYINQPDLLGELNIDELEQITKAYPYFTIGHLLLTKKMQQMQHLRLKKAIKKTAVISPNRKKLYEFLYKKEIQSTIIETQESEKREDVSKEATPEVVVEPIHEEPKSSFKTSVSISSKKDTGSTFSQPINLKDLGNQATEEMDLLEQQIIGQTIEHVLTQEIENNYKPAASASIKEKKQPQVTGRQSFSNWLEILDHNRLKSFGEDISQIENPDDKLESDLINTFLNKKSNIIHPTNDSIEFTPSNLARLSVVDDEDFVTETLANIYESQGNFQKALSAFNKLMLKYPEKKTYFAARIKKIEKDLK